LTILYYLPFQEKHAILFHRSPKNRIFVKHMQYLNLRQQLKDFLVFSLNDIRKIEPSFHRQRLNEWQNKGYIRKVVNEHYIFSDPDIDETALFFIANSIYKPSYISLESALSYYGLIPEAVYAVTSVASRTTRSFHSELANFTYRKIKPNLLFGYRLISRDGHNFKMAEAEKALLDYFYLNPRLKTAGDFEELRINKEIFREQTNIEKMKDYLKLFGNIALEKRACKFLNFMDDA